MKGATLAWVHALVFVMGLALMVGGIAKGIHGAGVVGLIVAAVNVPQWQRARRPGPPQEGMDAQP